MTHLFSYLCLFNSICFILNFSSALLASLWIGFRCDVLVRLRRFHFAAILDQQMIKDNLADKHGESTNPPNWEQLVQRERARMVDSLGPYLTALTLKLTDFPIERNQLLSSEKESAPV